MADYIERNEVIEIASMFFTMSMCASEDECRAMNRAIRIVEKRIDAIPAADVVPVVRCKDCICFHSIGTSKHNGDCDKHYERVQCDDFCSWAEKKDGDGE